MPVSRIRKKKPRINKKPKILDDHTLIKKALEKKDRRGLLPVRVLCGKLESLFFNISPDFKKEFENEVKKGLHKKLNYKITTEPIRIAAQLNSHQQIELFENFNQYLWSMSYSLLVLFDKGIHEPRLKGIFSGSFVDTPEVAEAWDLFKAGLSLKDRYTRELFFHFPNPEINKGEEYTNKASSIYLGALCFIMLHEFGHQVFGHYSYFERGDKAKQDEHMADEYAVNKMSTHFDGPYGKTLKAGILVGMLALLFRKRALGGGDTHPDLDLRIKTIIEKLSLDEVDNLWGIAGMAISLWSNEFNHNIKIPAQNETYQELFYEVLNELLRFR